MTIDDSATSRPEGGEPVSPLTAAQPWDGAAIFAFLAAIAGLLTLLMPLIALALGVIAIVESLVSRRHLRADARLRGAGLSATAFIVGVGVVAYSGFQVLAPMILVVGAAVSS